MEKTRYFRNANTLNVATNFLSGNLFPLGDGTKKLTFLEMIWVFLAWFFKLGYISTVAMGSLYFAGLSPYEIFKRTGAMGVLYIELLVPTIYLNLRRKTLTNLVNDYNIILIDSDDLRKCVHDTVEPYRKGLKFYVIVCLMTASTWSITPLLIIFNHDRFTYTDFAAPAYIPGEPFNVYVFTLGMLLQIFGSCSVSFGKISIDIYLIYFISVLSAQYKFVRGEIAKIMNEKNQDEETVIRALQNCIEHHSAIIRIGQKLGNLLALHIGSTYMTCIFKFCFLAFGVITFESANVEKATYVVYALACIVQVYLLCSSIQELLDVSTSVTEDAFHENWHWRNRVVKKIFCMMEMSNQMECRLTAYRIVDLVVPTLAGILSKSYSVCLLFLKVN